MKAIRSKHPDAGLIPSSTRTVLTTPPTQLHAAWHVKRTDVTVKCTPAFPLRPVEVDYVYKDWLANAYRYLRKSVLFLVGLAHLTFCRLWIPAGLQTALQLLWVVFKPFIGKIFLERKSYYVIAVHLKMTTAVLLIGVLFVPAPGHAFPFGPKYPVTASWFRDRFTYQEWNRTLAEFQEQGGDTVFLRAPPIVRRTREDLMVSAFFSNDWISW